MLFIHVHAWPDESMPDEIRLTRLADLVTYVQVHQRKQSKLDPPLSAICAHCSLGIQRSAAFLAAFIGNQMWIRSRRANVLGILQYIRRHRWMAFGMGQPFLQVRIVYRIVEVIAARYPATEGKHFGFYCLALRKIFSFSVLGDGAAIAKIRALAEVNQIAKI